MDTTSQQLFASALQLSDNERADLAAHLIQNLDPQVDSDLETAWGDEIQRRIEDLDSGIVTAIPWPEARRFIMGSASGEITD